MALLDDATFLVVVHPTFRTAMFKKELKNSSQLWADSDALWHLSEEERECMVKRGPKMMMIYSDDGVMRAINPDRVLTRCSALF